MDEAISKKKVLSERDGLEWMDVTGYWRKIHNESFTICVGHQSIVQVTYQGE
jgi:hypothetical protein